MSEDPSPSEIRLYHVVDHLRDDLRREIDTRLESERESRRLALEALHNKDTDQRGLFSLVISLSALALSAAALWWKH